MSGRAGMDAIIPYGKRIRDLADRHPDRIAVVEVDPGGFERALSWRFLDRAVDRVAARLDAIDGCVGLTSQVAVCLPNSLEHLVACIAAWRLGSLVVPINPRSPARERVELLAVLEPVCVIADELPGEPSPRLDSATVAALIDADDTPVRIPDVLAHPGKAIGSGGSTGRPKVVVDPSPWGFEPGSEWDDARIGFRPEQVQLVAGPLYHNSPFVWTARGLLLGQTIVLMRRFDADLALTLIERHRVAWTFLAPTMMHRMLRTPGFEARDLSSLEMVFHTAGPCAPTLKRAWIDRLGGDRIVESYGSTEDIGHTEILGDDWLLHPGSVGRPAGCEIRIIGDDGLPAPAMEDGEIFMRRITAGPSYAYRGSASTKSTSDGFTSIGDLGHLDDAGYLYLADRRVDLVVTGGANVYPAEVEGALLEHQAVGDVAVIGLPDAEWGHRVHAIVEPRSVDGDVPTVDATMLDEHLRDRIASYKRPKTYEFVERLPRDESGKIRRRALVEERA